MPNTPNTPYPNPQSRQSSATASRGPRTRPRSAPRSGGVARGPAGAGGRGRAAPERHAGRAFVLAPTPGAGPDPRVAVPSWRGLAPRPVVSRARGPPRCFSCNIVFFYYVYYESVVKPYKRASAATAHAVSSRSMHSSSPDPHSARTDPHMPSPPAPIAAHHAVPGTAEHV